MSPRRLAEAREGQRLLVREIRLIAPRIVALVLDRDGEGELAEWEPGSHINLELPSGLVRSYSLCGDPADRDRYRLAVLFETESTGGSREIHETGVVGKWLRFTGPINNFKLVEAPSYLLVAGGIGVTPLLAMARQLEEAGAEYQLVYGGRSRSQMAFVDELQEVCGERMRLQPEDREGVLDLAALFSSVPPEASIYCCGPGGMLASAEEEASRMGRRAALHVEWFAPPAVAVAPVASGRPGAFEVELRRTGVTVQVPRGRTILSVVKGVVPDVIYGCGRGFCRDCETKVIEGVPEHRDFILSPEEKASNTMMMICVSKAKSERLVLDL